MNLNLFNRDKDKSISNNFSKSINTFINQLQNELKNPRLDSVLKNDLYIIDRFEGDSPVYAVCQNERTGKMFDIRKNELPNDVEEGSVLKIENNKYVIDSGAGDRLRKEIQKIEKNVAYLANLKWNPILSQDSYKIERFEGIKTEYAVCQNLRTNDMFNIRKSELPTEAQENSIVKIVDGEYILDN